jgi:hypothetical protein
MLIVEIAERRGRVKGAVVACRDEQEGSVAFRRQSAGGVTHERRGLRRGRQS